MVNQKEGGSKEREKETIKERARASPPCSMDTVNPAENMVTQPGSAHMGLGNQREKGRSKQFVTIAAIQVISR